MAQLVRLEGPLPEGFQALQSEAAAAGHAHMDRLAREWVETPAMFHALLGVLADDRLIAIGGITDEPEPASEPAWRMRRLYVTKAYRRLGLAGKIVNALLQEALDTVRLATVHAGPPPAGAFWEAMGFRAVTDRPWSHEFRG